MQRLEDVRKAITRKVESLWNSERSLKIRWWIAELIEDRIAYPLLKFIEKLDRCYACEEEATQRCIGCGNRFCEVHDGDQVFEDVDHCKRCNDEMRADPEYMAQLEFEAKRAEREEEENAAIQQSYEQNS